jgi:hypothetical protein
MFYRRIPPHAPRLLLRIVATGTGALLGVAACGGDTSVFSDAPVSPGPAATQTPTTGDDGSTVMGFVGVSSGVIDATVLHHEPGEDAAGTVAEDAPGGDVKDATHDEQDAGKQDAGKLDAGKQDAGKQDEGGAGRDAADNSDGALVLDASDDAGLLHCPPVCGVVIGVVVHP